MNKKNIISIALILCFFLITGTSIGEVNTGQTAPNFNLQDQNGEWHTLDNYKGKWVVLFFYPKDQTPGCTTEACNFRDNIFEFEKLNAQILGVSLDDVESHQAFSEKYSLPYPILADVNKECATEYGVLGKFMMMTIAKRQSFLINPEGSIIKHYKKVDPDTHTQEVIGDLKKLTR
jgi:peroxiredoxin Q/BCP